MERIFEIASSISTPLALGGLFAAAVFFVFRQIVAKNIFPELSAALGAGVLRLIVERLFVLALVAMTLGFVAFLATNLLPRPGYAVAGSSSPPAEVEGEWQADIVYPWPTGTPGNMVTERFSLVADASRHNIRGSVSLLGKNYIIRDGMVDGTYIAFKTHGTEKSGETVRDVTYEYQATIAGDSMNVTLFTEGIISSYAPVLTFVARRAPARTQP